MALTEGGAVYGWGTFRDSSGVFGFSPATRIQLTPAPVYLPASLDSRIARIVSGALEPGRVWRSKVPVRQQRAAAVLEH